MKDLGIFIDESGDFGPFDTRCPHYIVAMVFHDASVPIFQQVRDLEWRLSLLGLENHCVHTSPAIRGEGQYHGIPVAMRRKALAAFAAFFRQSRLRHFEVSVRKPMGCSPQTTANMLKSALDAFAAGAAMQLAQFRTISVAYDRGQPQLSRILGEVFAPRFRSFRIMRTLPVDSRLVQAADYACTIRRIALRLDDGEPLAPAELHFFGSDMAFRRQWLKPLLRLEWK